MKILLSILFVFHISMGFSQIDFNPTLDKEKLFPEVTSKIKELNNKFDFQLRFWIYGGLMVPKQSRLFTMTLKKNVWICNSFEFVPHKRKEYRIIKNKIGSEKADSIWSYLTANKIQCLPDMEQLKKNFVKITKPNLKEVIEPEESSFYENTIEEVRVNGSGISRHVLYIADGTCYSIEFLTVNKFRRIDYHNPVAYSNFYDHIEELRNMSNIVKFLSNFIGVKEPLY